MHVRYVGPFSEVEVEIGGRFVACAKGADIDVPPAVAGRAPDGDDPGDGLLAQVNNWTITPAKKDGKK